MDKKIRWMCWIGESFIAIGSLIIVNKFSFSMGLAVFLVAQGISLNILATVGRITLILAEEFEKTVSQALNE